MYYDTLLHVYCLLQILDGNVITAKRTAAASAVATKVSMWFTLWTNTGISFTLWTNTGISNTGISLFGITYSVVYFGRWERVLQPGLH